jgi:hypothetical protein
MYRRSAVRLNTVTKPARLPTTCQVRKPRQEELSAAALKLALAATLKARFARIRERTMDLVLALETIPSQNPDWNMTCSFLRGEVHGLGCLGILARAGERRRRCSSL